LRLVKRTVNFVATDTYHLSRNARAEPKTKFAQDSPIRQWTQYPAQAA
jgi:hypothetical protein